MCDNYYTPKRDFSDSEESTDSNSGRNHGSTVKGCLAGTSGLSLMAEFDDVVRLIKQARNDEIEDKFLNVIEQTVEICKHWNMSTKECQRLQMDLDKKTHECSDLEGKLVIARKLLDQEKRSGRRAKEEKENLEAHIINVRDLLFKDPRTRIPDETREKLNFLNMSPSYARGLGSPDLSIIKEVHTTGSLLSDFTCSYSEDDLDNTALKSGKNWRKHRPSTDLAAEPAPKKRRSSGNKVIEINNTEKVRATTTLTVSKNGPITATSVIESVPRDGLGTPKNLPSAPPAHLISNIWQASPTITETKSGLKQHILHAKTIVMPDTCTQCEKRIGFGKTAFKCKLCRAICHPECKDQLALPCIPSVNTPTQRNIAGIIGDYTPTISPMVPAIIVHSLKEIESRGFSELGIYRVPGSEKEVKCLKEKFLRGKGAPNLSQIDIHVICGTVKDFLRSLSEPLVTYKLWGDFVRSLEAQDDADIAPILYQVISELPQPNRDTLAYMILHLKRVAEAKDCKMPVGNLAKIFGPTIVGYSSPDPTKIIAETRQQVGVMEHLINLPTEYWSSFTEVAPGTNRLQQTPSTDSLLRPTARGFFSPYSSKHCALPSRIANRKPPKFETSPFFAAK